MNESLILNLLAESPSYRSHAAKILANLELSGNDVELLHKIEDLREVYNIQGKVYAIKHLRNICRDHHLADKFFNKFVNLITPNIQPYFYKNGGFDSIGLAFSKKIVEELFEK